MTESPNGLPYYESENGYGIPVTFVEQGGAPLGSAAGSPAPANTLIAGSGSFVMSGETMTPVVDYKLPSAVASFALTGQDATFTKSSSFSITAVSNASSVSSSTSYTFTNQNVGSGGLVVVGIVYQGNSAQTVTGVTIAGAAASQATSAAVPATSVGAGSDIWYLTGVTGPTATIVISMSGSAAQRCAIEVYTVAGAASVSTGANSSTASSVSTRTVAATIPSGGGAIAIANIHTSTAGTITPTNLTDNSSLVFGNSTMAFGQNTSSSGSTTMGFSWAGTATDVALSIATFSP